MTPRRAAIGAALLLGCVVLFQIALVLGAPWGAATQGGGTQGTLPTTGRAVAAISAVLLLVMIGGLLGSVGIGPLTSAPRRLIGGIVWFTTIYSGLGVLMNLASPSLVEKLIWVPVTLIGFALSFIVLRGWRRNRPEAPQLSRR